MMKPKVLCVFGTRPEVIKMAPIIRKLKEDASLDTVVLSVSQHREMLDQMLQVFDIKPNYDLDIMSPNQTLSKITSTLPLPLEKVFNEVKPSIVLAQGDTTTAFITSLISYYNQIPFAHVEAGLRTGSKEEPFPEEMNRTLISNLSTLHFAPAEISRDNLLREGVSSDSIHVTGNSVVDSLHYILRLHPRAVNRLDPDKKLILVTAHRRENWDKLSEICLAIKTIALQNPTVEFLFPVHPNPKVSSFVSRELGEHPQIRLTGPLNYVDFVNAMNDAYLILSDSGGVQEEAPSLDTPVLVLRNRTERPEAIASGACKLVGTHVPRIVEEAHRLLHCQETYRQMIQNKSPFGDGFTAERIVDITKNYLAKR